MTWFFIFLAAFFAFFLYGLLRNPAEAGETFWGLFAFWRWFEERDDIRIGRAYLSSYKVKRWFNVILEHDDMQGDVYWLFVVIIFKRGFKAVYWGNTKGRYTLPKLDWRLFRNE